MTREELNEALLDAHKAAALDSDALHGLVDLYHQAFELNASDNPSAGFFYLTNAYVYALESDHKKADVLESLLRANGRL